METTGSKFVLPIRRLSWILYVMGLWPSQQSSKLARLLYTLYTIVFQTTFTFAYVLFKCINFVYITDLTIVTRAMFITLTELSLAIKIVNFYARRRTMQDCLFLIEKIELKNIMEDTVFSERVSFLQKVFWAFLITANTTGVFSYLSPVLIAEPVLPYPGWYPLDWMSNRRDYWVVYIYQVLGMFFQIQALVVIEVYFIYLMVVVSAHLEVLSKRLEQIGYNYDARCGSLNGQAERSLKQCVQVHQQALHLESVIEAAGSIPYFIQFVLSCIILCVAVFQIAIMNPRESMAEFVFYVGFVMTMLTQIFLPCYFGNEILLKSQHIFKSLYLSNWPRLSHRYGMSILLCMELMKRPKKLVVGQLLSLTLTSFLSVLNKAYSLYAVLQSFME